MYNVVGELCTGGNTCYCQFVSKTCTDYENIPRPIYYYKIMCTPQHVLCYELWTYDTQCFKRRPCQSDVEPCSGYPNETCYAYGDQTDAGLSITSYWWDAECIVH